MITLNEHTSRADAIDGHEPDITGVAWGFRYKAWKVHNRQTTRTYLLIAVRDAETGEIVQQVERHVYRTSRSTHDIHWLPKSELSEVVPMLRRKRLRTGDEMPDETPLRDLQKKLRTRTDHKARTLHNEAKQRAWRRKRRRTYVDEYGHARGPARERDDLHRPDYSDNTIQS